MRIIQIILAVAVTAIPALAQSASLSLSSATGAPGGTVTLSVTLATHGVQIAGVQWDLLYTQSDLSPNGSSFYVTGGAATAAGKQRPRGLGLRVIVVAQILLAIDFL